ncbi:MULTISPECIES: nucleotide exchange factor GrpE [unclassified Desulfosporosinus]|uniref:nucleotide exchange factor GrpE n=1 Tax=unclassified Desulfosporosinus TaxID=2633794 RepID=UPI0002239E66|nr:MULTISPECIES: nucleotide exchange factor GrpE [unclassified Desulfosporosinus]EGW38717.1 grpE family protein [Desulfosporosinus sp. OT]ODA42601.1 Heat shock protein GrpE [Desulfosporosinus sp. BG]
MAQRREEALKDQEPRINKDQREDTEGDPERSILEESMDDNDMTLPEKILTLEAELAQAKAKAEEHYDHLLRLQADFDNYRKRTQKEKVDLINYASERIVGDLLPILDNFERAANAAKVNPDITAFSQGVDMIFRQLQTALSKEGLKAMEAVGQPFDPNLHEAVLRVASEEHPENTVVEELQKGYYLKEKVLRPCMVKVSN